MTDVLGFPSPEPGRTPIGAALGTLAAADPERAAVTDGDRTVSRGELEARTNRLARAYAGLGVGQGSFVTIGLANGAEFLEAVIATWKLGAVPQPVSHRLPVRELSAIVALVKPDLVVGLDGAESTISVAAGFEPDPTLSDGPLEPRIAPSFKAPASGGSTGVPKVILSTDEATLEQAAAFAATFRMSPGGVQLATGPLSHNGPFVCAVAALLTGCHVVVMPRFDAAEALRLVERHRVDWMYSVPTMLHRFAKLSAEDRQRVDTSSLRTVITMAAACPQWLKLFCVDWLGAERFIEIYAATEPHAVTMIDGNGWLERPGSVGLLTDFFAPALPARN